MLRCYRALHKTIQCTFKDDELAISETKKRAREEFGKNKDINDPEKIKELLKLCTEVEKLLRTTVIQAKLNDAGRYEVQLKDKPSALQDNHPYRHT